MPWMPRYRTIADIRQSNRQAGYYFFERATMRFFDSKVERGVYKGVGGCYFITSEQFHGSTGSDRRKWTIRKFDTSTADIDTVGGFNDIATLSEARTIAKRLAATPATPATPATDATPANEAQA